MPRWLLAIADGESGAGGTVVPVDVDAGPFLVENAAIDTVLTSFVPPLSSPGRLTVGVSIVGWQDETPSVGYVADYVFDVTRIGDVWTILGGSIVANREVMPLALQSPIPWQTSVTLGADGTIAAVVNNAAAGGQNSHWQVLAWYRPAVTLATPPGPPYVSAWGVPATSHTLDVVFDPPVTAAGGVPPYRYGLTVNDEDQPPLAEFSASAPDHRVLPEGVQVMRVWVADSTDTISVATVRTCTVSLNTTYYDTSVTFVGANGDPLPAGWLELEGANGEQFDGGMLRTDTGQYRVTGIVVAGVPEDHFVTWRFPDASIGAFFGVIGRWLNSGGNCGSGVQVFSTGNRLELHFGYASSINWWDGPDLNNAVVTVTGGYPASWSETTHEHEITLGFSSNNTVTVYLDGSEFGHFPATTNAVANVGAAMCGEGANRHWTRMQITSARPEFVP